MTYKEVWDEQKEWLNSSIHHLEIRIKETTGTEQARIRAKLEGLKVVYQRMLETERIYPLLEGTAK